MLWKIIQIILKNKTPWALFVYLKSTLQAYLLQLLEVLFLRIRFKKYPTLEVICANVGCRKIIEKFVKTALEKSVDIAERTEPGWEIFDKR